METQHAHSADVSFDGGDLDCGSGLLLLIRRHIDPLAAGQTLEILSTDSTVEVDLPAWCRMTGNDLLSLEKRTGNQNSYLVRKGATVERNVKAAVAPAAVIAEAAVTIAAAPIRPLSVMGMGSWPRPSWMLRAMHDRMAGRMSEDEFQATANDAVSQSVDAQLRAGVDVLTDGEQRRDSYASFVGGILENSQLITLTDLLPYVSDPQ